MITKPNTLTANVIRNEFDVFVVVTPASGNGNIVFAERHEGVFTSFRERHDENEKCEAVFAGSSEESDDTLIQKAIEAVLDSGEETETYTEYTDEELAARYAEMGLD